MNRLQDIFGAELPVLAAPMAGGPSTPAMVVAAAEAGGFGFLAGGYRTTEELGEQIEATRAHTERFGVNLFVPGSGGIATETYHSYRDRLLPLAERYGVELPGQPRLDEDHWRDKVDLLLEAAPSVVSFTFAVPERAAVEALRRTGIVLAQTVTSPDEAAQAADAGMDVLVVQGAGAGGHSGTFAPERAPIASTLPDLVQRIAATTQLALIAGGGIGSSEDVRAVLQAGAVAATVGTALLLAPEAGTSTTHRRALVEFSDRPTTITRAFTGRPARGIRNSFIDAHTDAPLGYPAIHHLTQPIRRATAAANEPEHVHLWAGTSFSKATAQPVVETLRSLADV